MSSRNLRRAPRRASASTMQHGAPPAAAASDLSIADRSSTVDSVVLHTDRAHRLESLSQPTTLPPSPSGQSESSHIRGTSGRLRNKVRHTSFWQWALRLLQPRRNSHSTTHRKLNKWRQHADVLIIIGDHEYKRSAVVWYDPQCKGDLVSTRFLEKAFQLTFDDSIDEPLGYSIDGQNINAVGQQCLRWAAENSALRYEHATCDIVRSDYFDLIIGEDSIERLDMFDVKRRPIASFITISDVNTKSGHEVTKQTNALRDAEKAEKEKREEDKRKQRDHERVRLRAATSSTSP